MRFPPEAYSVDFFIENGYVRRKCKVCGEYFWTIEEDRDVCGESPCVPYTFIGKRLTREKLSLQDVRERFLRFFEKRGHTIIKPYPVVPRWRNDLYLVSASIVDFQPWVTSGIAPPPANPLVISQPCIRLVDIDKVGLTFGRHLTSFEMGGAHAFNYPDREVYWKDTTVRYHHEFATSELGIKPELITYKESVWSGGGNAGPCFETIANGLELATLVFMHYKTSDDELIEIPIKTVDTGYGIERYTWFSNGTSNAFEAVYGDLYWKAIEMLNIKLPEESFLMKYAPYTALVVPKVGISINEVRGRVARFTDIPIEEIESKIIPLERFFAALDYTKSIALIVSEGIVPSNVKAGYLARLLIRKAYRVLKLLGQPDKLLDLLDMQIRYWSRDFPHLADMRDEVLDIVSHEVMKFKQTIERGTSFVERELRDVKRKGQEVSEEFLVRVYDEKGITPDIVEEVASKLSIQVKVPENFYELVASRHLQEQIRKEVLDKELEEAVYGLKPTEKLFYDRPFDDEFDAKVVKVYKNYVILDRTLFYAESGGQIGDTGTMSFEGGSCKVLDTLILNGVILHKVSGDLPKEGDTVSCKVDIERRFKIMRHHTATHILLGACRKVLGMHVWQAGARKEEDRGRLDISHHKRLTQEEIERIEKFANQIVMKRIPVKIYIMDRNEAERIFGFRLYQGGEVPSAKLRIVEIPGWDAQACGGLHCENTEDVGLIKIVRTERIQDGVERLVFVTGPSALDYILDMEKDIRRISETLDVPTSDVTKKVDEIVHELQSTRKLLKKVLMVLSKLRATELLRNSFKIDDTTIAWGHEEIDDNDYLISLAAEIVNNISGAAIAILLAGTESLKVITMVNEEAVNRGMDAGRIASLLSEALGGKGGGRPMLGQGGAPYSKDALDKVLKELPSIIKRL